VVTWWSTILLNVSLSLQKSWQKERCCSAAPKVAPNKMPLSALWKTDRTTLAPLVLYCSRIFGGPAHTAVSADSIVKFKRGFIKPNNEISKRFPFITHVQKRLSKFQSTSWPVLMHRIKQSWYVRFPHLIPQNAINAGPKGTNLTGTLPYRLLRCLCEGL
jgi:hypothetical protein